MNVSWAINTKYACLVCLPLAIAACGVTRPPASVSAPIPAQWNAPLPTADLSQRPTLPQPGSLIALTDWWRQLDDPLLVQLIEAAETASPDLASAAARVAEARATRIAAGASLFPSLNATLSATRSNSAFGSTPVATGAAGATPTAASGSAAVSTIPATTLQAGLQSQWEIDLFGRLRADRDAALQRYDSADARWHGARVSVAAETANAYFAERTCEQQLAVAENDTRSRSETARLTDLSARAGFTAPADAALARAGASDSAARLTQQRAACFVQRKALVALTGIDARDLGQQLAAAPLQRGLPSITTIASVPAQTLAQRPDIYAAELAVSAASADVGSADAERYPKLTISGSISRLQIRSSGFREALDSWSIGPLTLTLPLFDFGAREANVGAAKARYDEAVSQYRANVRTAVREVEEALVNLDATASRTGDADTAVQNYQASFNATQARYDSGLASLFELEDSRRTLFAAQTSRVSLQRERAEAWVSLYRSTGGGWVRPGDAVATSASTATTTSTTVSSATTPSPTTAP
jgi:multidrug efflux system outer membrane protein